jgi:hypothetical protein
MENEIELKFRENVLNGYKIPFEGAKDIDEGANGEIDYQLDCSNETPRRRIVHQSSNHCLPLFQLFILSSSPNKYDQLALKFVPSSYENVQNEYKLKVTAIDKNAHGKELQSSMNLIIKIERKEEKTLKFSLSEYEFIILLNSSLFIHENIL